MIKICMKASHKFFEKNIVKKFSVIIDRIVVELYSEKDVITMTLQGNVSVGIVEKLWADIYSIIFIYLGAYPKMISMLENNEIRDYSLMVDKYNSWDYMAKPYMCMCQINETTINQKIVNKYRNLNNLPIYSMEYLISESYKNVILNHRITLLLHVIDGLISDKEKEDARSDYINIYRPRYDIGTYKPAVYYLCNNYFFKYEEEFSCKIMSLLKKDQHDFIDVLTDTRHFYSHWLKASKKKKRLIEGKEMLEYFEIIYFSLRLHLLSRLGVVVEEERIKEYLYIIHDWILETDYKKKFPVKSIHYQRMREIEEVNEKLKKM